MEMRGLRGLVHDAEAKGAREASARIRRELLDALNQAESVMEWTSVVSGDEMSRTVLDAGMVRSALDRICPADTAEPG